jgi:dihydrofolate reductase
MRKIIFGLAASLDGYIARENGAVDWLKMEDLTEAADEMREFFALIDTVLTGRKTYEKGLELGQDGYDGLMNYVFTGTPRESKKDNVRFITEDVKEFVENLKKQKGKNMCLTGGGILAETFFAGDLIDEIVLGVQPTILGAGIPLFPPSGKQIDLELFDVKTRKSGTVQLSYRVKRQIKKSPEEM